MKQEKSHKKPSTIQLKLKENTETIFIKTKQREYLKIDLKFIGRIGKWKIGINPTHLHRTWNVNRLRLGVLQSLQCKPLMTNSIKVIPLLGKTNIAFMM